MAKEIISNLPISVFQGLKRTLQKAFFATMSPEMAHVGLSYYYMGNVSAMGVEGAVIHWAVHLICTSGKLQRYTAH